MLSSSSPVLPSLPFFSPLPILLSTPSLPVHQTQAAMYEPQLGISWHPPTDLPTIAWFLCWWALPSRITNSAPSQHLVWDWTQRQLPQPVVVVWLICSGLDSCWQNQNEETLWGGKHSLPQAEWPSTPVSLGWSQFEHWKVPCPRNPSVLSKQR